jgi:hypothetical protein
MSDSSADKIKSLAEEIRALHRSYMERFSILSKRQEKLLREVVARVEGEKISRLTKDVKNKRISK